MQALPPNVTERVWKPASEPGFTSAMFAGTALASASSQTNACALAVYLDGDAPTRIFGHLTDDHTPGLRSDFCQHWHRHAPQRFNDVGFLIDTYRLGTLWSRPERNHDFRALPAVDDLLRDSRGILLWHHQLENLYRLFEICAGDAVAFRKGVHAKKAKTFDAADRLQFASGISLSDVIWERMIFGVTSHPSFRAAPLLYNVSFQ